MRDLCLKIESQGLKYFATKQQANNLQQAASVCITSLFLSNRHES
jgi:hypothetical protein